MSNAKTNVWALLRQGAMWSVLVGLAWLGVRATIHSAAPVEQLAQKRIRWMKTDGPYPRLLRGWGLFVGDIQQWQPHQMLRYELNVPLFSDYVGKHRFVWIPPKGPQIQYFAKRVLGFPRYTILVKAFVVEESTGAQPGATKKRPIEVRLLLHTDKGWRGLVYVWQQDKEAKEWAFVREPAGATVPIYPIQAQKLSRYVVPNEHECKLCHQRVQAQAGCRMTRRPAFIGASDNGAAPLGPTAGNLHRNILVDGKVISQLSHWAAKKYLTGWPPKGTPKQPCFPGWTKANALCGAPAQGPKTKLSCKELAHKWEGMDQVSQRHMWALLDTCARVYLAVNCAHCHRSGGLAAGSRLGLSYWPHQGQTTGQPKQCNTPLGINKEPVFTVKGTQGIEDVIAPGQPMRSLLLYRMLSSEPSVRMPPSGRQLSHREGNALVHAWIAALPQASLPAGPKVSAGPKGLGGLPLRGHRTRSPRFWLRRRDLKRIRRTLRQVPARQPSTRPHTRRSATSRPERDPTR